MKNTKFQGVILSGMAKYEFQDKTKRLLVRLQLAMNAADAKETEAIKQAFIEQTPHREAYFRDKGKFDAAVKAYWDADARRNDWEEKVKKANSQQPEPKKGLWGFLSGANNPRGIVEQFGQMPKLMDLPVAPKGLMERVYPESDYRWYDPVHREFEGFTVYMDEDFGWELDAIKNHIRHVETVLVLLNEAGDVVLSHDTIIVLNDLHAQYPAVNHESPTLA